MREIAQQPEQTNRYLTHFALLGGGLSLLVTVGCWLVLPILPVSAEVANGLRIISLAVLPAVLNSQLRATFIAWQRVEYITAAQFILTLLQLAASLLLLWRGAHATSVLIALTIDEWATFFVGLVLLRQIVRLRWSLNLDFLKSMAYELRTFALLSLLAGLFSQPEVLLLPILTNDTQTGFFSAAYKLITLWLIVPQVVMTNLFPLLARAYHQRDNSASRLQDVSISWLMVICLPIATGMAAAAHPIITIFYGEGYEAAVVPLQLMAMIVPLNALIDVFWRVLAARHQQHLDLQVRLVTVVVRLVGGYLLISRYGIVGPRWRLPCR